MIDFAFHIRPTSFDAAGGVALATRLAKTKPAVLTPAIERELRTMKTAATRVSQIAKARGRVDEQTLLEPLARFHAAWGALHAQVGAWARLGNDTRAREADKVLRALFRGGLEFVQRPAQQQHFESARRLERIGEENLEASLKKLADPDILAMVRSNHAELGEALGLGESDPEVVSTTALRQALRELSLTVSDYVRVLAGMVVRGDEASERAFLDAIEPLIAHRESLASRRGILAEDVIVEDTDTDVPPSPIAPVVDEPTPG